jgi:hypothetical protein
MKLRLFNLIIMAEPTERRSKRSRKPKVYFGDQIAESIGPSNSSKLPKGPAEPTKSIANPTTKPLNPSTRASASPKPSISTGPSIPDPIERLCGQTEGLDTEEDPKSKKKAKAEAVEIARLKALGLEGAMEEVKPLMDVQFEPFNPGHHRESKVNIPSNIDPTDPLALLDLFIPPEIYITIAGNTNLYATAHNAPTIATPTNRRYWWPTNENEIRVLFGILFYMGVHREPDYKIYWETPTPNGPIHAIPKHMSLNRYENLRRYLHVSPPKCPDSQMETQKPLEPLQASPEVQELQESPLPYLQNLKEEEQWWWKLEPILGTFRTACQTYLIPGTGVAIDEIVSAVGTTRPSGINFPAFAYSFTQKLAY